MTSSHLRDTADPPDVCLPLGKNSRLMTEADTFSHLPWLAYSPWLPGIRKGHLPPVYRHRPSHPAVSCTAHPPRVHQPHPQPPDILRNTGPGAARGPCARPPATLGNAEPVWPANGAVTGLAFLEPHPAGGVLRVTAGWRVPITVRRGPRVGGPHRLEGTLRYTSGPNTVKGL